MPYLNGGLFLKNELDEKGYKLDDSVVFEVVEGLLERLWQRVMLRHTEICYFSY